MAIVARNIFELLSMDERAIVYSSEEDKQVYTWDGSQTLQCWNVNENGSFTQEHTWIENELNRYQFDNGFLPAREFAMQWKSY